ncbi:MAG: hypothetical protein FWB87_13800 [Defluviitaleaceae bacterium]|nr:hypothetical protein [Defluviitaleaceae bacterium]
MILSYLSKIGTINALFFTDKMVANLYKKRLVSIYGFGLVCKTFSSDLYAAPRTVGFNLLQEFAKACIAARVKSISYTPPSKVVKTGV